MALSTLTARLVVRIAWRNVRRNWRHSLAALGTMAVGFLALALFQGYLDDLVATQVRIADERNMIGDVLVRAVGAGDSTARIEPWKHRLGEREQRFLEGWIGAHASEVKARARVLFVAGVAHAGGSSAEFWGWSHDLPEGEILRGSFAWNAVAGRPLGAEPPNGVLLSLGIAATLGCEATSNEPVMDPRTSAPIPRERPFRCKQRGLTFTTTSQGARMNAADGEVVGLTTSGAREFDERMVFMPLAFAQELADTRDVSLYMIALKRKSDGPRIRAELGAAARQAGLELEVTDWHETEAAELLRRGLQLLSVYRGLVVMVILIIAGTTVLTTMMKVVRERTREVGTLRSLGFSGRHLLATFAVEAAVLALHAGAAGLLASLAIITAINHSGVTYNTGLMAESIPLRVAYSPAAWAWGLVFLVVVAVIAALLAAWRITRMHIAAALNDA